VQVTVYGSGDATLPATSVYDIAAWLTKVVLDPTAAGDTYLIGNVLSLNEIVAAYEEVSGAIPREVVCTKRF
jgi:nucleoside-diphosphate-sugar epimerase